jgi:anthranilate phosphoribosyltransferase
VDLSLLKIFLKETPPNMETIDLKRILKTLMDGQVLAESEAEQMMLAILSGEAHPEQIGAMLTALHFRAPVADELSGFVKALRSQTESIHCENSENILDVCGTGGDGVGSFNVSTSVAFVVAATGQKVAKHGNRAVSSRCGSFDVLEALGVPFATTPAEALADLSRHNLSFLFAPAFYPVLQKLGPLRRNLGVRTVFNALGPLLNPLRVGRQLMGVYSETLLIPVAEAFRNLGAKEVLIVRGEDATDELSLAASTRLVHLKNGHIEIRSIHPSELGLTSQPLSAIAGGDSHENARLLLGVLQGQKNAYRDVTLLNASAALMVAGQAKDLSHGVTLASEAIDSGRALLLLENMRVQELERLA